MPQAHWRNRSYGRLTGSQFELCLEMFRECWAERETWPIVDREQWLKSVTKLMGIPNWVIFYQDSLVQLLAKIVVVSGVSKQIENAASSNDPAGAILNAFIDIPDDAPDHPAALPLAFAMVGNLDAIARYSRSINDMVIACRENGEIQALFDALSVDSYVSTMPFFQAALRLGQLSGDASFAEAIFKAVKGPHKKRLEYPELRWAEYLLRDQGAFDTCSREEIYELIAVHIGIYDSAGAKKDPKAALFTLFRAWQKQAGIQNPRFGFSVKRT